ncbi:MAG: diaminopimelate epimerase [Chitinophagales bacterium]
MQLKFYKYQGTGNDFIIFDNRDHNISVQKNKWFVQICDRRFGIGADGVMLLNNKAGYDFEMVYFNADGNESSMCGNGGRCMIQFAASLGMVKENYRFLAVDGAHDAYIKGSEVYLKMNDVNEIVCAGDYYELDTGSPHYVTFTTGLNGLDIKSGGAEIRFSEPYRKSGINVNFLEEKGDELFIRTYERGVEDETLSCGTGVTASAIIYAIKKDLPVGKHLVGLNTIGGKLKVQLTKIDNNSFSDIWLIGPAEKVFEGTIEYIS